ncbi:hypothetical protein Sm713_35500 [Streptomyces sp. TS71-3]|nr:hypothetical protein Sm713_35500 [Streptomyces sp. TS71-3]
MQHALGPDPCLQIGQALAGGLELHRHDLPYEERRGDHPQGYPHRAEPCPCAAADSRPQDLSRSAVFHVRHALSALPSHSSLTPGLRLLCTGVVQTL